MKPRKAHDVVDLNRAAKFQFGHNAMKTTSFEEKLIRQEAADRERVRIKQVLGMQGSDGGRCWDAVIDRESF